MYGRFTGHRLPDSVILKDGTTITCPPAGLFSRAIKFEVGSLELPRSGGNEENLLQAFTSHETSGGVKGIV